MKAPCKDCPDRHELCHMECERYLEYRKERDRMNEDRKAEKQLHWDLNQNASRALRAKLNRFKRDH